MREADRRTAARLHLAYPMDLRAGGAAAGRRIGRTVTGNLSARGVYFTTFDGDHFSVGKALDISISVPHRVTGSSREILLDLRGSARVVRKDAPRSPRLCGENGGTLTGVALHFENPLRFDYHWV
jgi:hypothetical protein